MSQQAEDLALQLERAVADFESFVHGCPGDDWSAMVPIEERTVGVMAMHCAAGLRLASLWLEPMRRGHPVPGAAGELDAYNALEATEHAGATPADVLAAVRRDAPATVALLRSLTDDELAVSAPFGPGGGIELGLAQVAASVPRHFEIHLGHVREALSGG